MPDSVRLFCVVLLAVLTAACAPFAPETRSALSLPASYAVPPSVGESAVARGGENGWWRSFGNSELDALIREALGGNFDVRTAGARLLQLEAEARKSGAELWPSLTGSAGADHTRRSTMAGRDAPRQETASDSVSLGAAVSYELDLWGRVRSAREADLFRVAAGAEDVRTAAMTVAASVAEAWVRLVSAREEIRLVESQIETNRVLLEVLTLRFANALGTGLDVLQQQEVYAASLAELPPLRAEESVRMTQLAILLGTVPGSGPDVSTTVLPALPPAPAAGIPAELLEQRPDIRSAWYTLMAADWAVSTARADRLPALTLTAEAAYSGQPGVLFSNWLTSLAAGLTAPIFDGGRRAAEVDRTLAVAEEQVQHYGKTVATAVGEVQDALNNEVRQREYVDRLAEQLRYATFARDEAQQGYLNGRDDFLRFITEHKNVQTLERRLLQQTAALLGYRIELHRALGGDLGVEAPAPGAG